MSFSLTEPQIRTRSKTVTRRGGWLRLKAGDLVRPVRKVRGLAPGEKVTAIGPPLRVRAVSQERLDRLIREREYGRREVILEGYGPGSEFATPEEFVAAFCASHRPLTPESIVTRIEFEYTGEI